MSPFLKLNLLLVFVLLISGKDASGQTGTISPAINDHFFPAAAQAKPYIDFDSRGFLVNGKRTFIVSAGIEYARVPRGLWRDRLLRLKRGGFNAVEIYTFWNYHEPREGKFNFSGDHDLNAFLKLVKEMGMYSIVRVGPYYCGEWDLGGYPVWLKFKPGLRVREDNPQFIAAVDRFFNKLIPIVTKNQIQNGGSVIMVQLENEHLDAWGTVTPNGYFKYLKDKVVSLGLKVPYYFSQMHPGNDPAGNDAVFSLDDPQRPNPWFSAEYWAVWFFNYGAQEQDSTIYDRRTWKIIAHGGNGYNVYMGHGGTNFDYNNARFQAASYDYGAAVGQTGDLRPIYFSFKRAAWFARSFQDILQNSVDATNTYKSLATDTSVVITARSGPSGAIVFLDNQNTESAVQTKIKAPADLNLPVSGPIDLAPGEIRPVVSNYTVTRGVRLLWAPGKIYNVTRQGNTTTLLIYGKPGETSHLYFSNSSGTSITKSRANFRALSSDILEFSSVIPSSGPAESAFEVNGQRIRIIAVNEALASRSWVVETAGQNHLVLGPLYAADAAVKHNKLSIVTERPWASHADLPVWLFKPMGDAVKLYPQNNEDDHVTELTLRQWEIKNASEAATPSYDDKKWKSSINPLQMGADGDISAYAWYRSELNVPETGKYTLRFKTVTDKVVIGVKDSMAIFLNGKRMDTGNSFDKTNKSIDLDLIAGRTYSLAVFTAHNGRDKLMRYSGVIDTIDSKGLSGTVTLKSADGSGPETTVTQWRMKGGPGDPFSSKGWKPLLSGKKDRPHFFRTTFSIPGLKNSRPMWRVVTSGLSSGSVWVNGHNLGRYPEVIRINGPYIPETWLKKRNNMLVIYDQNGARPDKVSIQAELTAGRDRIIFAESAR